MPCYAPIRGWLARFVNASGKRSIVFDQGKGFADKPVNVPCGQCIGCRLERSRQWAVRCVHESALYDQNCFITLTYAPEVVPPEGTLVKGHFQKFMKRLRKRFANQRIRFFHCGEYGEKFERPHYHACLFGFDFSDKVYLKAVNGYPLYTSEILGSLWPFGYSTIGSVSFESAAYVARYITKKVTGDNAAEHYGKRLPEYVTMSRRPGIASDWFSKFRSDVYPDDFIVLRGRRMKPPKFFDKLHEVNDPEGFHLVKVGRAKALLAREEEDSFRLRVREVVKGSQVTSLKRRFENDV